MTAPTPHGYPDYGKFVAQADKILFDLQRNNGAAFESFAPIFVGDIPAISVFFSNATQPARVNLRFWDSLALGIEVTGHAWDNTSFGINEYQFPVMAPWMTIELTFAAGVVNWHMTIASNVGRGNAYKNDPGSSILMSQVSTAVAAGGISTVDIAPTRPGPALLNIDTSMATWLATLSARDYLGNLTRFDTITNAHAKQPRPLELPTVPIRFTFQNTTAAAGAYTASIVARAVWPDS